ncbi:MAG: hypothetical protein MJB14_09780, partial [Spirochaetes bacterium]|nr:hypothetical protein [Spirochaetota bacterium]
KENDNIYASVQPMMVSNKNLLADIEDTTNAVRLITKYSGENFLIGKGAGCLETGSAVVSDIVFISKYQKKAINPFITKKYQFKSFHQLKFAYNIIFETEDVPGITGLITTAIGNAQININTVSHNRHNRTTAVFSIITMPCTYVQVENAIKEIKPEILKSKPKLIPILY